MQNTIQNHRVEKNPYFFQGKKLFNIRLSREWKTKMFFRFLFTVIMSGCIQHLEAEEAENGKYPGIVVRKDYDIAEEWKPKLVMGKNFWHILLVSMDTHPVKGRWAQNQMRELVGMPLFKESGFSYNCVTTMTVPNTDKVSVSAMEPHGYFELMNTRPDAPFFIMPKGIRPVFNLFRKFDHDNMGYLNWKKAHPNFMGCVMGEIDNDFLSKYPGKNKYWLKFEKNCNNPQLIADIKKGFPKPENREELTSLYLKACKSFPEFFFKDSPECGYMRAAYCHDHYYYECGAGLAWLETTNTGLPDGRLNYRHQISLFFTRGAAHQYNKNWAWYIAVHYNGYDDTGKFSGANIASYQIDKPVVNASGGLRGPGCGMSESLLTRDMFLAYLGGASFVAHEGWWWAYLNTTWKEGRKIWDLSSPLGRAWEDWFEFTKKNPDRGTSYTPVALLVPFEQGYPNYGGRSWGRFRYERPDWMIDAFMYAIMPHSPVTKEGKEGGLANSPYGDIFDVIVPNTPGKPVNIHILNNYKVAVMLGRYPEKSALTKRLMEYVRGGGTLLLNIKQIDKFFPAEFLGFHHLDTSEVVTNPVRSLPDDKVFNLSDKYSAVSIQLTKAVPLLVDGRNQVLICKNSFGKGNLIVSTVDYMVPEELDQNSSYPLDKMVYGKKFPFVEYCLRKIVGEVLPVEVKGDIEYGLNKVKDGWWIYLINNKGVTKFTNKPQKLDMTKTANIEVFLKNMKNSGITELRTGKEIAFNKTNNSFVVTVPPGEVKVVKIKN